MYFYNKDSLELHSIVILFFPSHPLFLPRSPVGIIIISCSGHKEAQECEFTEIYSKALSWICYASNSSKMPPKKWEFGSICLHSWKNYLTWEFMLTPLQKANGCFLVIYFLTNTPQLIRSLKSECKKVMTTAWTAVVLCNCLCLYIL